jgi:hypothetical protein
MLIALTIKEMRNHPKMMVSQIGEKYQANIPPFISNYDCNYSPEIPNDTWSKIEKASLMLGLYIFGKNLICSSEKIYW